MQNARSGARKQHRKWDEEVLSPADAQAQYRGQELKRHVRSAAALRGIYTDTDLAKAAGVKRGAVKDWWDGAQMKPDTIRRLADATGWSPDELTKYVYFGGPPPTLTEPALLPVLEGIRRDQEHPTDATPDAPPPQPEPRPRGSEAERGRRADPGAQA